MVVQLTLTLPAFRFSLQFLMLFLSSMQKMMVDTERLQFANT